MSYGSNMARARLVCYLAGGRPQGARRRYAGARDRSLPREDRAVHLPGRLWFAGESSVWGGGMAFYDHDAVGPTPARAYRITAAQLADVAAQEMHRSPTPDDPLEAVLLAGIDDRHAAGPGRYETLVAVGHLDGLPMLTFTAPHGHADVPHAAPSAAYVAMIGAGLRESHGWSEAEVAAYLATVLPRDDLPATKPLAGASVPT
ncbi:histone deacetylase [Promicromonospora iranensis]|uniref:histone deacetylase n=1 Tax=Promicromonospora iranensis TaxID=1105144 RepID=UPI0023AA0192|nr:histone deacetylase [Promicromonospora iranensis]